MYLSNWKIYLVVNGKLFYFVAILQFLFLDLFHFHTRNVLEYFVFFNDMPYIRAYTYASMVVLQNGFCPIRSL